MLASELVTTFGRLRTRVLLALLVAVPVVYAVIVTVTGSGPSDGPPFLGQVPQNGLFAGLAGLTTVSTFLLPMAVAVVAGDAIAGEADAGTLRYLLTAPVSRARLLMVKLVTAIAFALVAAVSVATVGLLVGAVLFPLGPVPTALGAAPPSATVALTGPTLSLGVGILRLLLAAMVVGLQSAGLAAVGIFVSTLTRAPVGAIAATAGVLALSEALHASVAFLVPIQPWLLNTYWDAFGHLFHFGVPLADVARSVAVSMLYVVLFYLAAWLTFSRADVTA